MSAAAVAWRFEPAGRRRARHDLPDDDCHWAPKWRRVLAAEQEGDYAEFDRTVRGMLNRISVENARRLLPLDPSLRSAPDAGDDCPPWWATRFAALMLSSYLQVINTNRCARGLLTRSADNVLPKYLDAVSPLLAQSPRLVTALAAWLALLLQWHDLCWPTLRLLLLASREPRERASLPASSLGRLPGELVSGRILGFLCPPRLSLMANDFLDGTFLGECVSTEEGRRDAVAVLAHLLLFAPSAAWPRLSGLAFPLAEAALAAREGSQDERVFLAASAVLVIAQRLEHERSEAVRKTMAQDLRLLSKLIFLLQDATASGLRSSTMSPFVMMRAQVAVDRGSRVRDELGALELGAMD